MRWLLRKWDFFTAALLAAMGTYFLPHNAVKDITTELLAFFSIQSAVILPAMIFTAGILKPDGLELSDAKRYHKALKAQMLFWVMLLGLDFIAVMILIAGKALHWTLTVPILDSTQSIELGWILLTLLLFTGSLAIFRTIPFVRGVLSLLDLNSDMTQKAIKRRNRRETIERNARADSRPMSIPDDYGAVIGPNDD
jgi:signal transduction histidine kinase|tara:strand:- start:596 stop:1183 length:588 start_codon:yes stop_codon:yes gene_type:complete